MTTFTWLHLSDFHQHQYEDETSKDRELFEDLLKDIRKIIENEKLNIDAIFFTGDLAYSGQEKEYNLVADRLDRILDTCNLSKERDKIFIVPGNHDVNREEIKKADHKLIYHETLVKELVESDDTNNIQNFLFKAESPDRELIFSKLNNFSFFIKNYLEIDDEAFNHRKCYSVRNIEKNGFIIAIICINSAWLSLQDNEQGKLLVGEIQICDALEEVKNKIKNACLKIVLIHHPIYWLAEKEMHTIQQHISSECKLILRGHLHCPNMTIQCTPDSYLYEFAAGASLRSEYQAYNIVNINLNTLTGNAILRLKHTDFGKNWGPDSFTYRNIKDGKLEFSLNREKNCF